eukprot:Awhi_evm1s3923
MKHEILTINLLFQSSSRDDAFASFNSLQHNLVIDFAKAFVSTWSYGSASLIQREQWFGLKKQWLTCNSPAQDRVLILEDDLELSLYFFKYLQNTFRFYKNHAHVAGFSLQRQYSNPVSPSLPSSSSVSPYFKLHTNHEPFLYFLPGSWGFCPQKHAWDQFMSEFLEIDQHLNNVLNNDNSNNNNNLDCSDDNDNNDDGDDKEGIEHLKLMKWYQHARDSRHHNLWSLQFAQFLIEHHQGVLHANLPNNFALATSWRQDGEHYENIQSPDSFLLPLWSDDFIRFPETPRMITIDYFVNDQELSATTATIITKQRRDSKNKGNHNKDKDSNSKNNKNIKSNNVIKKNNNIKNKKNNHNKNKAKQPNKNEHNQSFDLRKIIDSADLFSSQITEPFYTDRQYAELLRNKTIFIFGDSVSRYQYQRLNWLLAGVSRPTNYKWNGFGKGSLDYDERIGKSHDVLFTKHLKDFNITTKFNFVKQIYSNEYGERLQAALKYSDVVVYNSGFWDMHDHQ